MYHVGPIPYRMHIHQCVRTVAARPITPPSGGDGAWVSLAVRRKVWYLTPFSNHPHLIPSALSKLYGGYAFIAKGPTGIL